MILPPELNCGLPVRNRVADSNSASFRGNIVAHWIAFFALRLRATATVRWRLGLICCLVASCYFATQSCAADSKRPPNIVIVFCDDLGYGDVGVFGAKGYATPNIDRMAAEGIRFTRFYAAQAVCSASRAALLTGCYPNRIGIKGALGPKSKVGINSDEMTLAELVKQRN